MWFLFSFSMGMIEILFVILEIYCVGLWIVLIYLFFINSCLFSGKFKLIGC